MDDFVKALNGAKGDLDAWLECNNEAECRVAIFAAIEASVAAERECCAKLCDPENADRPDDWTEYSKVRAECEARIRNFGKEKEQ